MRREAAWTGRSAPHDTGIVAMTADSKSPRRVRAAQAEQEMLARLGLTARASRQEIETARDDIVRYLSGAPAGLGSWARRQEALVDQAYALLADPAADLDQALPWAPGTGDDAGTGDDVVTGMDAGARGSGIAITARSAAEPARPGTVAILARRRPGRVVRTLAPALALVGVLAVGYIVYAAGAPSVPGISGTPAPEASSGIDTARVAQLMGQIQQDPQDVTALTELGDIYFAARDYQAAATWMSRVLAIDPQNVNGLLGLGAAKFNQGDLAGAETEWRTVVAVAPDNQEAYYDLGYVYLSTDPPDMTQVRAMWDKVIEIDPTTDVARTVQTHLTSLAPASPAPSGAGSPAAVPSSGAAAMRSSPPSATGAPTSVGPTSTALPSGGR